MAQDYNSFKKITSAGIIDGTITSSDLGNLQVTGTKLQDSSVTNAKISNTTVTGTKIASSQIGSSELANNAVDVSSAKVTGTLPVSRGGTGRTSVGSANYNLRVNGSANGYEYDRADLYAVRVYTGNSTWNKPAGVTRIKVQIVGGGGGGTGHGEAGGGGGFSEEVIDVTSISSVAVTIGGGGGGVNYHNSAGNGGTTSFGPYLSASGGEGARRVGGHSGGRPGVGSGGNLNIYGGGGAGHTHHGGGHGGRTYFGGPAIGVHDSGPTAYNREGQAAPGAGGTGGPRALRRGANGRGGMVLVWEYK